MFDLPSLLFIGLVFTILFIVFPTGWFLKTDREWREVGFVLLFDPTLLVLLALWLNWISFLPSGVV